MKIVLNKSMDYFCLSKDTGKLFRKYLEEMGDKYFYFYTNKMDINYRTHPALLRAIEEIGLEASCANGSKLVILDVPEITEENWKYFWVFTNDKEGYENGYESIIDTRDFMKQSLFRLLLKKMDEEYYELIVKYVTVSKIVTTILYLINTLNTYRGELDVSETAYQN